MKHAYHILIIATAILMLPEITLATRPHFGFQLNAEGVELELIKKAPNTVENPKYTRYYSATISKGAKFTLDVGQYLIGGGDGFAEPRRVAIAAQTGEWEHDERVDARPITLEGEKFSQPGPTTEFTALKSGNTTLVFELDDRPNPNRKHKTSPTRVIWRFEVEVTIALPAPNVEPAVDPGQARGKEDTGAAVQRLAREVATLGWILFDSKTERGDRDLFLARPDGSGLRNITNTPELSEIGGRFSPDGKKILYRRLTKGQAVNHDKWGALGQLVIANADGSAPTSLGKDEQYPWASWSPDGTQIACLEKKAIRIYDVKSGKMLKELPRHGIFIQLFWSPDGKRLCGTANFAGQQWNIVAIDVATGKATLLSRKLNCTSDWFQQDPGRVIYSNRTPGLGTRDGWTMMMQATADGKSRSLIYAEKEMHIYCGCTSPDDQYVILTRWSGDGGIDRAFAIIRLSDTPIIVPGYKALEALYPDAGGGPVLHLTDLPVGFEPHWTYADIKEK